MCGGHWFHLQQCLLRIPGTLPPISDLLNPLQTLTGQMHVQTCLCVCVVLCVSGGCPDECDSAASPGGEGQSTCG